MYTRNIIIYIHPYSVDQVHVRVDRQHRRLDLHELREDDRHLNDLPEVHQVTVNHVRESGVQQDKILQVNTPEIKKI